MASLPSHFERTPLTREMDQESEIEFGDQRAKDLIDIAYGEPDPHHAIELLLRALSYGTTGIQAGKAYSELGGRNTDLGDISQAITCYTRAIEVGVKNPYDFFWRGCLHYRLGSWEAARDDFRQALAMQYFWAPEREEAKRRISRSFSCSDRRQILTSDISVENR